MHVANLEGSMRKFCLIFPLAAIIVGLGIGIASTELNSGSGQSATVALASAR